MGVIKNRITVIVMIGLWCCTSIAQNERIENKLLECEYLVYTDNGKHFKQLISEYQNLLIEEGILASGDGESYRKILQNITDNDEFKGVPSKLFREEIEKKFGAPNKSKEAECMSTLIADTTSYDLSKLIGMDQVVSNIKIAGDFDRRIVAKEILDVLMAEDFELDYYKMKIFLLFEIWNTNTEFPRQLSGPIINESIKTADLNAPLKVYLNEQNEIIVYQEKVDIETLKAYVHAYELENKSRSLIILKSERKSSYDSYVDVQNAIGGEIRSLQKQLAQEMFNAAALEELTKEQLAEIKKVYPFNVAEQ